MSSYLTIKGRLKDSDKLVDIVAFDSYSNFYSTFVDYFPSSELAELNSISSILEDINQSIKKTNNRINAYEKVETPECIEETLSLKEYLEELIEAKHYLEFLDFIIQDCKYSSFSKIYYSL